MNASKIMAWALLGLSATTWADTRLEGVWLNQDYAQALKHTCSPRAAVALHTIPLLWVSAEGTHLSLSLNMHEMPEFKIENYDRNSGVINLSPEADFVRSLHLSGETLHLEYFFPEETARSARFFRVAAAAEEAELQTTVETWVAQQLLVGEYQDQEGNSYHFTPSEVDWKGERFTYQIILDYVLFAPMDLLCQNNAERTCDTVYAFTCTGNIMQIYTYNDETMRIGHLLVELSKSLENN
jgi:hypothetical protein